MTADPLVSFINGGMKRRNKAATRPDEWADSLARDGQGMPRATLANALIVLAHDPLLAGMVGYDAFAGNHLLLRPPPPAMEGQGFAAGPYPRTWQAGDVALAQAYMQREWNYAFSRETVEQALVAEAERQRFHPVCDWLSGLRWDGKQRLKTWLVNAFGAPNEAYHAAVGEKWLIAAVKRVRRPGCKFDHSAVFEGAQGLGKSTVLRTLFGDAWFSDAAPHDLASRDAALSLMGVWCLEFAELEQLIRSEAEIVKAFLTRQVDRYRPPYGRNFVERPRQCVMAGTTNSQEWLTDPTGNRRFWPVSCTFADVEWVGVNRDQLWAEAAICEAAGATHWLDVKETQAAAEDQRSTRLIDDAWGEKVQAHIFARRFVTVSEILEGPLSIPTKDQNKSAQMRVAAIMVRAGWRKERNAKSRFWVPPSDDQTEGGHEPES
jgi:predicted P-loop ATPase